MSQSDQDIQSDDVDIKNLLVEALTKNGTLQEIQDQLTAAVYSAFYEYKSKPSKYTPSSVSTTLSNLHGVDIIALVIELLQSLKLFCTLKVLTHEAHLNSYNLKNREDLAKKFSVSTDNCKPLLMSIIPEIVSKRVEDVKFVADSALIEEKKLVHGGDAFDNSKISHLISKANCKDDDDNNKVALEKESLDKQMNKTVHNPYGSTKNDSLTSSSTQSSSSNTPLSPVQVFAKQRNSPTNDKHLNVDELLSKRQSGNNISKNHDQIYNTNHTDDCNEEDHNDYDDSFASELAIDDQAPVVEEEDASESIAAMNLALEDESLLESGGETGRSLENILKTPINHHISKESGKLLNRTNLSSNRYETGEVEFNSDLDSDVNDQTIASSRSDNCDYVEPVRRPK